MAYGLQFTSEGHASRNGFTYTLKLYENGTSDASTPGTFRFTPGGLVRSTGQRGDDPNEPICESRIKAEIIDPDEVIYHRLAGAGDRDWKVVLEEDGTTIGEYYLIPDSVTRSSGPQTSVVSFAANDALAYLNTIPFVQSDGTQWSGRAFIRTIIQRAAALTGFSRDLVTLVNWRPFTESPVSSVIDPLDRLRADQGWLVDRNEAPYTAREVLRQTVGRFLARFFQSNEGWVVVQRAIASSWTLSFSYASDGSAYPVTPPKISGTLRTNDDLTRISGGSETKLPALRDATVAYSHGSLQGSNTTTEGVTGNGSFDIWNEGEAMPEGWRVGGGVSESDISRVGPINDQGFGLRISGIDYTATSVHPEDNTDGYVELDQKEAYRAFTVSDVSLDRLTVTGHEFANDDQVIVFSSDTLPAGLTEGVVYFVIVHDANTISLSDEEGGDAVDIGDTGTGTHKIRFLNPENYIVGGEDRHIIFNGRARLIPNSPLIDPDALYTIRCQRYVVGDAHTWYAKEDGTWSIDSEYTMSVGGKDTKIGTLPTDSITLELQDSNGDDVTGQIHIRVFRQQDDNVTDTTEPLQAVDFDGFGVLYQETTEAKAEPTTTITTVSVDDTTNAAKPEVVTYVFGDGPTGAHQGRLTVYDGDNVEQQVTGGWKAGSYSSSDTTTGVSIDKLHAQTRLQERRSAVKRRSERFRLASGKTFPFYCTWQNDITRRLLGFTIASPVTDVVVSAPFDVGAMVKIDTSEGEEERIVTGVRRNTGVTGGYVITVEGLDGTPTLNGEVTTSELYTTTYLVENFLDGEIQGEFVQYLPVSDTSDLTTTTTKTTGQSPVGINFSITSVKVEGAEVVNLISDLSDEPGGSAARSKVARRAVSGGPVVNALYVSDPSDTSSTADGVLVRAGSDGVRWKLRVPNGRFDARLWGSNGDGVSDDTTPLQNAFDEVPIGSKLIIPEGRYRVTSPITITRNFDLICDGIIVAAHSGAAITFQDIGRTITEEEGRRHRYEVSVERETVDHSEGSIGVKIERVYHSEFMLRSVVGFTDNVVVTASNNTGCVYNEVHLGRINNGKRNLVLDPDTATGGWVNQNIFYSGRLHMPNSGTRDGDYINLFIDGGVSCNGNTFIGTSLEDPGISGINANERGVNTAYALDDTVWNRNKRYVCSVAGTSDSRRDRIFPGPVGTGAGEADGTVEWDFDGYEYSQTIYCNGWANHFINVRAEVGRFIELGADAKFNRFSCGVYLKWKDIDDTASVASGNVNIFEFTQGPFHHLSTSPVNTPEFRASLSTVPALQLYNTQSPVSEILRILDADGDGTRLALRGDSIQRLGQTMHMAFKRFVSQPTSQTFEKGDISWRGTSDFVAADICSADGEPGTWEPLIYRTINASDTIDVPSLAEGERHEFTITVSDCQLGDFAFAEYVGGLSGLMKSVSAENGQVRIVLLNLTGSTVDLASGEWRIRVEKRYPTSI